MGEHRHTLNLPHAEPWSLWAGSIGLGSLYVGFGLLLISLAASFFGHPRIDRIRRIAFTAGSLSFTVAFAVLVTLFVNNQFHFDYVFGHGDFDTELKYKIAGTWTAQQGSFLLWAMFTGLFGAFTAPKAGVYSRAYTGTFAVILAVLAAILLRESPFNLIPELVQDGHVLTPPRGQGMTPALQNYWVVIHPPIIFLGFGSLAVPFAYAVASLLGRDRQSWVAKTRAVSLFGMTVLGVGICLGGLWAYETLGWGGFWMWDPVENASFVPWLLFVAFCHAAIATAAKRPFGISAHLLALTPFISFVYGTFLTRSGLLDKVSVHSFASMDQGAKGILKWFLIALPAFSAVLLVPAWKSLAAVNRSDQPSARGAMYGFGNQILSLLAAVIALGMSWPVLSQQAWVPASLKAGGSEGAAIKEPVYHLAVVWFFIPIMLLMAIAPFATWKKESLFSMLEKLVTIVSLSIALTGVMIFIFKSPAIGVNMIPDARVAAPFKNATLPMVPVVAGLMLLCNFVFIANFWRSVQLAKRSRLGLGGFVTHMGVALLLGGLIISRAFERDEQLFIREGKAEIGLGYEVQFAGLTGSEKKGPGNQIIPATMDRDGKVKLAVTAPNGERFEALPGFYYYMQGEEQKPQVWPYVRRTLSHDIYFSLTPPSLDLWEEPLSLKPGESKTQNQVTVKYVKPTRVGEAGTDGVTFGADIEVTYPDDTGQPKTYRSSPTLTVSNGQLVPKLDKFSPDFGSVLLVQRPEDRSILLRLMWAPPVFPVRVFYKPLTSLIWIGIGVMMVGGLMSAAYRRVRLANPESEIERASAKISERPQDHATVPAP